MFYEIIEYNEFSYTTFYRLFVNNCHLKRNGKVDFVKRKLYNFKKYALCIKINASNNNWLNNFRDSWTLNKTVIANTLKYN